MADPVRITYSIRDDRGKLAAAHHNIINTATVAQAQTEVTTNSEAWDVVTGGVIEKAEVTFPLTLPGTLKSSPVADSLREKGALFGFSATGTSRRWSVRVPALDLALITGGELVDVSSRLADFVSQILTGVALPSRDEYNNILEALLGQKVSDFTRKK